MTQSPSAPPSGVTAGAASPPQVTAGMYPQRWKALGVLVVGLLVVILDNTILNVALKTIQQDLAATQNELVWAINAYSLAFAALLFTWGVLGDRFGRKRILLIGLVLFGFASALCAFASSPGQLIAFRALMGIGGASVMPISLSIITVIFPPQERGKAIGVWAAAVGGAVALRPVLGGLLLEHPNWFNWLTGNDWGSVFFINVPIVIIGIVGIMILVPETKNPRPGKLDPLGLLLSVVGLFLVVYGIQNASSVGWGAASTWGFAVLGAVILAGFVLYEAKSTHPSIDLSLFRIRSFSVPLTGVSLAFAAMQGTLLFLTFYYQIVRGWSPLQAGLLVLPFAVGQLLGAPRSAKMVNRFGARVVITVGLAFALTGMLCFAFITPDTPVWFLIVVGVIFGFGLGNTIAPSTTRMTLATPPERSGSGSAVQNTVRQVGAVFGVAILSSVVGTVYGNNIGPVLAGKGLPPEALTAATDSIGGTNEVADRLAASGAVPTSVVDQLRQVANDSFMPALHTAAFVSAGLLLIAIVVILLRLPAKAETVAWAGSGPGSPAADSGQPPADATPTQSPGAQSTGALSTATQSPGAQASSAQQTAAESNGSTERSASNHHVSSGGRTPAGRGRHAAQADEAVVDAEVLPAITVGRHAADRDEPVTNGRRDPDSSPASDHRNHDSANDHTASHITANHDTANHDTANHDTANGGRHEQRLPVGASDPTGT